MSKEYIGELIYDKPMVHGFLSSALISELITFKFQDSESIYNGQNMRFLNPVYHEDAIKCFVTVTNIDSKQNNVTLSTAFMNQNEITVLSGTAFVKQPKVT